MEVPAKHGGDWKTKSVDTSAFGIATPRSDQAEEANVEDELDAALLYAIPTFPKLTQIFSDEFERTMDTFTVSISRACLNEPLGVDVGILRCEPEWLRVGKIEEGAIHEWNKKCPESKLYRNCRIVRVNDCVGSANRGPVHIHIYI